MPKDTKTLGNNKTQACESLGFAHKKRGYVCFDTPSYFIMVKKQKLFNDLIRCWIRKNQLRFKILSFFKIH